MTDSFMQNGQSCKTLHDWLCYIEQSHPIEKIELGLGRVQQVAEVADLHNLPGKKILIAGTNGKGTTARTLEQLLLVQGYSVAVYTSPHLLRFNERLRLNGQDASDEQWVEGLAQVEAARGNIPLTYFEFTTLAAFAVMKTANVEICIVEVGLGGRLDATNIITPDISVITTIDLDHQDWLGNDRDSIAREKAGIFRTQCPAVIGELSVPASMQAIAEALQSSVAIVGRDYHFIENEQGWQWIWQGQTWLLPRPTVPMQNVATSLTTLALLQLLPEQAVVAKVLTDMTLPGRMHWLQRAPAILLDVAHNPQSAMYLAKQVQKIAPQYRRVSVLIGMLKDKDITQSLASFGEIVDQWHCVSLPGVRGASAEQVQQSLPLNASSQAYADIGTAWQQIIPQLQDDELLVIFGSFVTVSAVLELWQQDIL